MDGDTATADVHGTQFIDGEGFSVLTNTDLKEETFPGVYVGKENQQQDGPAEDYETGAGEEYVEGSFDGIVVLGVMVN